MATVYPQDSCVHSLFEAQVARTPDTTALIFEDAQLTYQELNQRANQVADRLRVLGIGPEALVGICMERSFELVIGVLGILKAGGAYIPLDASSPPSRLALILEDAQVVLLLTRERLVAALPAQAAHIVCLEPMIRANADEHAHNPTSGVAPGNLAYVIYTSGSTGRPKGVLVEHRNLVALLHTCQQRFGITSSDVMPWLAPAMFDIALFELFNPLLAGGTTRILARRHVLDVPNLIWTLEQSTLFHAVPSLMRQIVQMIRSGEYNRAALDHIRMIFVGGDLVTPTLLRELQETFESAEIVVLYGPTESTVICTQYVVPRTPHLDECVIGAPLQNMYIYLCDSQQLLVSGRTPGEICVGGTGVARGYLNRPDLTAERFVPNPLARPEDEGRMTNDEADAPPVGRGPASCVRLYHTGDLARYRPDDTLEFLGRIDEQVKVRGYRIEPGEIELLLAQHPRVQEVAVIAQAEPSGEKRLIAYLVPYEESVQLWPSIGEYFVYDELIYYGLTHDERRNTRYKAVLQQVVCDKVVVDIGTGSDAILARLCAEAGARKVYAIEILPDSYRRAQRLTTELGLEKTITLIHGDATEVSLPEPADICVSEIVEAIGGAEGAAVILNHARRLLTSDGVCIPERSVTKIAAARLPDELIANPRFSPLARHYVEQIFAHVGYPFDVRLCIKHFPASNLLSDVQVFEDLDFTTQAEAEFHRRITLRITKTGRMDGFLLWLNLHLGRGEIIDILDEETAWFPAYFPIFEPGIDVQEGDRIEAICSATLCENQVNPDYAIRGTVIKSSRERISFEYESAHHSQRYRATPFYRRLFRDEPFPSKLHNDNEELILGLRDFLAARLPEYMLPALFVPLDAMPHTLNGKIDRGALSSAELLHLRWRDAQAAPRTPVEELLAGIWSQLLGLAQIGRDEHFFVLGGHSLLATQLISRIRQTFQVELRLPSIFNAPTVAALAERIERAHMQKQGVERPAIGPVSRDQPLRLSFPQEMVWILAQLAPENIAYHFQMTIRLKGRLDIVVLQRALAEIVGRHEILRTTFAEVEGHPAQLIHPPWSVTFPLIDLHALPQRRRERLAEQLVVQELGRSFIIARLPLIRWILVRLDCDEHLLIQIEHHFVHDGWSISVLLRELKALYTAFLAGERSPLAALPIQYADFAAWQRQWMEGEAAQAQLGYWQQKLADRPPLLEIPSDYPRPNIHSFRGGAHRVDLPADLYPSLKALSQRNEVTLFMTLLAAYKLLLYRYTAQADLLVGSTVANRQAQETEGLIGMIVNTIILRTDLSGDPTFVELLRRIRAVTLEAYAYQELPFEKLVEALQPQRDVSHNPLFQVGFSFHDAPVPDLEFGGLSGTILERHNNSAKFDLSVVVIPHAEQRVAQPSRTGDQTITMLWEYSTDLFEATTITRMIGQYVTVLRGIIADPSQRLADAPLLTAAERNQLLVEWNATNQLAPPDSCIQQLFESQAARTPDAVALIFHDRQLTYAELNRRANQLAHYLQTRGVGAEMLVGICMERSLDMIIGLMGILKAGGAYVPLEPTYPPERLAFMIADAQIPLLLTHRRLLLDPPTPRTAIVDLDADASLVTRFPETNPRCPASADNLAYVLYTSGSTGRPKGVMIAHQGLVNIITTSIERFNMRPTSRLLQLASLNFDASALEIYMALLAGSSLCLVETSALASSDGVVDLLRRQTIDAIVATPSFLEMLPDTQLPDLETIIGGGESCSAHILARWGPGRRFFNAYAPTETTIYTTFHECAGGSVHEPPIGRPVANTRVYVLDRHMQPTPIGVPGEICIGGVGVARGYLNRPDLTAERFVPNPFVDCRLQIADCRLGQSTIGYRLSAIGYRLYKTGDLARYRPNGALMFLGRTDSQVKVRGFRIELGEIEAILRQHAQVRDAVVETSADAVGGRQLVAYLVTSNDLPATNSADSSRVTRHASLAAELRAFLKAKLPNYMIPATFISLDALPLTPTGKLDRGALPAPDPATRQSESPFVEPRTPIERALADIWGRLLGLDRVSATDNFFDLGGHSLLATQAISHTRAAFLVDLPLLSLFDAPTIRQFAHVVEDRLLAALESLSEEEAYLLAAQVFQPH